MILHLSPTASFAPRTVLSVAGDVITRDGEATDFSDLAEGEAREFAEGSPYSAPATRIGGVLHVTVQVCLGVGAAPVQPDDGRWTIDAGDGPVTIPVEMI